MKHLTYINNLSLENIKEHKALQWLNPEVHNILLRESVYPIIDYSDKHYIFVIIIPIYNPNDDSIDLIECDIIKQPNHIIVTSNTPNAKIDSIINNLSQSSTATDDILFELLIELCSFIFYEIDHIERRLLSLQRKFQSNFKSSESGFIQTVMQIKLSVGMLKSTITPFVDVIEHILETITVDDLIKNKGKKDQLDQIIKQIISQSNFLYENINIIADTYNSIQNLNINNIMKTLTIISAIFIPLSFITGIFGMNFKDQPGLDWLWRYHITMTIMCFIWLSQLYVFKKKWRI